MKTTSLSKICLFLSAISLWTACKNSGDTSFSPTLIPVKTGEKWGYVNFEGKYEINPQFSYAGYFVEHIALVSSSDKYGFIDEQGKYLVNPQYKSASNFSEGFACVVPENGKIKFIDKTGQLKFELQDAEYAGNFHSGLAKAKIKDKWGFIDNSGKILINPQFDYVIDFTEDLSAFMNKNDKGEKLWGFIDKTGKILINAQFKSAEPFKEGLAAVSSDGKQYGFIDKTGKYVINPQFESVSSFFNGLAAMKQGSSWGIINKEGKITINPQFADVQLPQSNNLIAVKSDSKWGYINPEGKYDINPQFDKATNFIGTIAIVELSEKIGFIDTKGKYTSNPQFDDFSSPINFSCYGVGYTFTQVETDFFDINLFAGKILTGNKLFQIDENTTVANISSSFKLKDDDFSKKGVVIQKNETLENEFSTKDIQVKKLAIYFSEDAYNTENKYETYKDYWGTTRQRLTGSTKILNNETKASGIEGTIKLTNKGEGKGENLAQSLKENFLKAYNLQELQDSIFKEKKLIILTHPENKYLSYIEYKENSVTVYLSFVKEDIEKLMEQIKKMQSQSKS